MHPGPPPSGYFFPKAFPQFSPVPLGPGGARELQLIDQFMFGLPGTLTVLTPKVSTLLEPAMALAGDGKMVMDAVAFAVMVIGAETCGRGRASAVAVIVTW